MLIRTSSGGRIPEATPKVRKPIMIEARFNPGVYELLSPYNNEPLTCGCCRVLNFRVVESSDSLRAVCCDRVYFERNPER